MVLSSQRQLQAQAVELQTSQGEAQQYRSRLEQVQVSDYLTAAIGSYSHSLAL